MSRLKAPIFLVGAVIWVLLASRAIVEIFVDLDFESDEAKEGDSAPNFYFCCSKEEVGIIMHLYYFASIISSFPLEWLSSCCGVDA